MAKEKIERRLLRLSRIIILAFSILLFITLINLYFQQDEWHSFGLIQSYGWRYIFLDKSVWELLFTDRVGARLITFILFNVFGLSAVAFGAFAAVLHIVNSFFVGVISHRLTKNRFISLLSALFFLMNSVGHQAYSWFGTMAGSASSLTFMLVSLLFYLRFLEKRIFTHLYLSILFLWASFLFKESGYFLFVLYPILWFFYSRKKTISSFIHQNAILIVYGSMMTLIHASSVISIPGERANYIKPNTSGVASFITHLIAYPTEGMVQTLIPSQFIFESARLLTQLFVPTLIPETSQFDLFYTTKMTEGIVVGLFFVFAIGIFHFYKKYIKKSDIRMRRAFVFSLLFSFLSFLPYIVLSKFDAYLDSRYYYVSIVGISVFFGIVVITLSTKMRSISSMRFILSVLAFFVLSHAFFLAQDLYQQIRIASERKSIIRQVLAFVPQLNKKTVLFVIGNNPGYYGIPELKIPFQSGVGQVLMVVYGQKHQINPSLFKETTLLKTLDAGFLYDTLAQGYKELGGHGFGYFYENEALEKALKDGQFKKEDVVPLFYDSDMKTVRKGNVFHK